MENLFIIELNKNKNEQNEDLNELFKYLDKISKDNIYSFNNKITILKNKSFTNLFKTIFDNISINIYNKYQTILIQFFKDFIKNNFNDSGIIEKMVNNLKNSFLNLSVIDCSKNKKINNKKNLIEKDLINQNIYFELLGNLFNEFLTCLYNIKYFNFNGKDSKISLKLKDISLINTITFFSFCLECEDLLDDIRVYPLLTIYDGSKSNIIFKLYLKEKTKKNKFKLYIIDKGKKEQILINDLYVENNKFYYIALNFEKNNINIHLNKKSHEIKITNTFINEGNIIQIGYDNVSQEYFKGIIGPLYILKNNDTIKNNSKIIPKILRLKEKYTYLIYSISNDYIYNFDYLNSFQYYYNMNKEQIDINNFNLYNLNESKIKLECVLFFAPSFIEYTKIKTSNKKFDVPLFPDCKIPQDYSICELNISIIKYESIPINFLLNNGLYAICLQYEYLYQLSFILFKNTKNNDSDISLINKEARDIISNILNNSITILLKYSNQLLNYLVLAKNILLNLFNAIN